MTLNYTKRKKQKKKKRQNINHDTELYDQP